MFDKKALRVFHKWVREREKARRGKETGLPKPWTKDPIIQRYKFCNVRRMDDRVSKWLLDNWYDTSSDLHTLLIAAALARLVNWPDTLECLGLRFRKWDKTTIRRRLHARQATGNKIFTGAYIINGAMGGSKIDQVVNNVNVLAQEKVIRVIDEKSMQTTHTWLMEFPGIGSFIAGQIVADLRWVADLFESDRDTWAPIGPGSRRGMRRLIGLPANGSMTQKQFDVLLVDLIKNFSTSEIFHERGLEAMDVQNCLCEFDKYSRVLYGEGRARSHYPGA